MTVKEVLWRFALAYVAVAIVLGYIVSYLGFEHLSGLNIGILCACVFWACNAFGRANKRYFTGREKVGVVVGLIAIDLALQMLFSLLALSQMDPAGRFLGFLPFAVLVVGALHAVGIYFMVGMVKKSLVDQGVILG